jgi:hypothetical protein
LRSTRYPVSGVGKGPTDQKVGGSTPSERAELTEPDRRLTTMLLTFHTL